MWCRPPSDEQSPVYVLSGLGGGTQKAYFFITNMHILHICYCIYAFYRFIFLFYHLLFFLFFLMQAAQTWQQLINLKQDEGINKSEFYKLWRKMTQLLAEDIECQDNEIQQQVNHDIEISHLLFRCTHHAHIMHILFMFAYTQESLQPLQYVLVMRWFV